MEITTIATKEINLDVISELIKEQKVKLIPNKVMVFLGEILYSEIKLKTPFELTSVEVRRIFGTNSSHRMLRFLKDNGIIVNPYRGAYSITKEYTNHGKSFKVKIAVPNIFGKKFTEAFRNDAVSKPQTELEITQAIIIKELEDKIFYLQYIK